MKTDNEIKLHLKKVIIKNLILFIIITVQSISQTLNLLSIDNEYLKLNESGDNFTDKDMGIICASNSLSVQGKIPIVLSENNTFLINTIAYQNMNLYYFNNLPKSLSLKSYGLTMLFFDRLNNGSSLIGLFNPKIGTDSKLSAFNLTFNFGAAYNYKFNEAFTMGMGIYYIHSYNNPLLLPIFNILWKPTSIITVNILFPDVVNINYKLIENLDIGLSAKYSANQYYISESEIFNGQKSLYFRYFTGVLGPEISYQFMNSFNFTLSTGIITMNNYEFFFKKNIIETKRLKNNIFLKCSLNYNINTGIK